MCVDRYPIQFSDKSKTVSLGSPSANFAVTGKSTSPERDSGATLSTMRIEQANYLALSPFLATLCMIYYIRKKQSDKSFDILYTHVITAFRV